MYLLFSLRGTLSCKQTLFPLLRFTSHLSAYKILARHLLSCEELLHLAWGGVFKYNSMLRVEEVEAGFCGEVV